MKKLLNYLIIVIFISLFIGLSTKETTNDNNEKIRSPKLNSVKKLSQIIAEKKSGSVFQSINLFSFQNKVTENDNSSSYVKNAVALNLQRDMVRQVLMKREENIVFSIPVSDNSFLDLELTQSYPVSENFILTTKDGSGTKIVNYTPGLHYNGIIKGKENSIASISIFKDFIMGVVSDETGNYVLGSLKNPDNTYSDNYIFYNDADLLIKNKFKCNVDNYEDKMIKAIDDSKSNTNQSLNSDDPVRLPVKVYFEADYQLYLDGNSDTANVSNFIIGMFNSVKTIYQNEAIPAEVSQIGIWTSADPYRNLNDSYSILLKFGVENKDNFQGNVAHLISTRTDGLGGIAWIRVLCFNFNQTDSSGRYAFSNIDPNYNNFPTYSWTVNVVTHEMGHSMGSRHTHACDWPILSGGAIGAIDSCYFPEGSCFSNRRPTIGTIMSYCHLWAPSQGGGVNLSAGFGPLPGDTIRLRYSEAHCLDRLLNSSDAPSTSDLAQNFPNPFNPGTTIKFTLSKESIVNLKVFDITGRLVANLVQNKFYNTGFYHIEFNSSQYNLSSGIYFYRIEAAEISSTGKPGQLFSEAKRMVLIK